MVTAKTSMEEQELLKNAAWLTGLQMALGWTTEVWSQKNYYPIAQTDKGAATTIANQFSEATEHLNLCNQSYTK